MIHLIYSHTYTYFVMNGFQKKHDTAPLTTQMYVSPMSDLTSVRHSFVFPKLVFYFLISKMDLNGHCFLSYNNHRVTSLLLDQE